MSTRITDPGNNTGNHNAIRFGEVAGVSTRSSLGHSDSVGTTICVLYALHSSQVICTNIRDVYDTPQTVKVASTSTSDTSDGTGARTVLLSGVDSNLEPLTEIITMNGRTAVTSTETFKAVEKVQVLTAGDGGSNAGDIWVGMNAAVFTTGVPDLGINAVETGTNISATAFLVVPKGKKFYVNQFTVYSGDTTKILNFQFYQYSATTGLWYEAFDIHGKQEALSPDVYSYPPLNEGDIVMLRVAVDAQTAIITGSIGGYLVEA